jgi:hypothetical protein
MSESRPAAPQPGASVYPFCIATCVSADALSAFREAGRNGTLRDEHPWLIAAELLAAARATGARVPLLLATEKPLEFRQWAFIERIDVVELRRGSWESACEFRELAPMNPIWTDIDSVLLKPGDDQLRRERLEPIRIHRFVLDAQRIHPYAICETPAFIANPSPPGTDALRASDAGSAG